MNKVILEGRITQDVTIKEVGASKVAHITLATNRTWRDKQGQEQKETSFIKCVLWNQCAQQVQDCKKGSKIYIEGRLKQNKWLDKETQKERSELIVMVNLVRPGQQTIGGFIEKSPVPVFDSHARLLDSAELELPF